MPTNVTKGTVRRSNTEASRTGCEWRGPLACAAGARLTQVLLLGLSLSGLAARACPTLQAGVEPVGHITGVLGNWMLHTEGTGKSKAAVDSPVQLGCALPPLGEVRVSPSKTGAARSIEIMLANGKLLEVKDCKPADYCKTAIPDINPSFLSKLLDVVMPKLANEPKKYTDALREGSGRLRDGVFLLTDNSLALALDETFNGVSMGDYTIKFSEALNNGGTADVAFHWDGTNGKITTAGLRPGLYAVTTPIDQLA